LKLALTQIEESGQFLRTEDQGLLAAQAFVGGWFAFFGSEGLKYLPFQGTYLDQPAELMDFLGKLGSAIAKTPR